MNTFRVSGSYLKNRILLDGGCSSTIVVIILTSEPKSKKYAVIQWKAQSVNIKTNRKVKIDFTLPEFSAMEIVMFNCDVDDSTKISYDMIMGREIY